MNWLVFSAVSAVFQPFNDSTFGETLLNLISFEGNASRFCDISGTWQKTRVSYCADAELSNALNEVCIVLKEWLCFLCYSIFYLPYENISLWHMETSLFRRMAAKFRVMLGTKTLKQRGIFIRPHALRHGAMFIWGTVPTSVDLYD